MAKNAPPTTGGPVTTTGKIAYDPLTFAQAVLSQMGLPVTPENLNFMTSWESAEGGNWHNTASFNPLNTSQQMPGELGTMGTQGNIRRYANWQQGVDATVKTISNGRYAAIINALKNSDAQGAVAALVASPWDKTHYASGFPLGAGVAYAKQNGATPDGVAGVAAAAASTPAGTPDQLASTFGFSSAFFNSDPSLKNLINSFSGQDPTNATTLARFQAALKDTPWYKTHSIAQRSWAQLQTGDPTEAAHQLLTMQQQITQQSKQMGVPLNGAQVKAMATSALSMYGQNVPQGTLSSMIGAEFKYNPGGSYSGDVGNDITTLKDLATSYGVPISDQTLQGWLHNIVQNGVDPKSYTDYLKMQAVSLHPTLKPQLDQGLTFQQAVDPVRQVAAQKLSIDPATVDFGQAKWQNLLQATDPSKGVIVPLTLAQVQQKVMSDPVYGYDKSPAGMADQSSLAGALRSELGF